MLDCLIKNALLIDGSGSAARPAEMAIQGGKITRVEPRLDLPAEQVIDAAGRTITPGFIDMHSHSDILFLNGEPIPHKLLQGVTTELIGQDGLSVAPLVPGSLDFMARTIEPLAGRPKKRWVPCDTGQFLAAVEAQKAQLNLMTLTGHCNLRLAAMGHTMAEASPSDLETMRSLLAQSMEQGSFGLSLGLIYPPSSYSNTAELISLGEVAGSYGGIVVSHMRDEQRGVLEALDEMIEIGLKDGVGIHISHLKCLGKAVWGRMPAVLERIDRARDQGVDITFDQYPYDASNTSLSALLPGWALEGGWPSFAQKAGDAAQVDRMLAAMKENIASRGGADGIMIASAGSSNSSEFVGGILAQAAARWDLPAEEAALKIILQSQLSALAIYHAMSAQDVELAMTHPLHTVGSDGVLGEFPHPRAYGAFARILSHYQAEKGLFSLEEAINHMTGKPAGVMKLKDRGLIKPGYHADFLIFDPGRLKDKATYNDPANSPEGMDWVFVNGTAVVVEGEPQPGFPGKVIRRQSQ